MRGVFENSLKLGVFLDIRVLEKLSEIFNPGESICTKWQADYPFQPSWAFSQEWVIWQELLWQIAQMFYTVGLTCVTMGDAAKFLDLHVRGTVTVACERGRLYHPLKLCNFHHFEGISASYFTTNISPWDIQVANTWYHLKSEMTVELCCYALCSSWK